MSRFALFPLLLTLMASVVGSASIYAEGTPDEETPANEGVCDGLKADGITKGLYGLCVAFCEAQDCNATVDAATGEVAFDENCRPSNPKLLENYNKRRADTDPRMPCVNVIENECPCWTELELDALAPSVIFCGAFPPPTGSALLAGLREECPSPPDPAEIAETYRTNQLPGAVCHYITVCADARVFRYLEISVEEYIVCNASIAAECAERGF